jgi:hypothetical protein
VSRLIPADDQWPGALEAGVPNYIDKQLGGAWGAGERFYRGGPWRAGTPSQGYQLSFTPAELYRTAVAAINDELKAGTPFAKMKPEDQDAYLHSLEAGGKDLGGVPSNVFFSTLWDLDLDPTYKDARGLPLLRMTFDFPENDIRMSNYVTEKTVEIGRAMGVLRSERSPIQRRHTKPLTTLAARSWVTTPRQVPSIAICNAGTYRMCSSSGHPHSLTTGRTIQQIRSAP